MLTVIGCVLSGIVIFSSMALLCLRDKWQEELDWAWRYRRMYQARLGADALERILM